MENINYIPIPLIFRANGFISSETPAKLQLFSSLNELEEDISKVNNNNNLVSGNQPYFDLKLEEINENLKSLISVDDLKTKMDNIKIQIDKKNPFDKVNLENEINNLSKYISDNSHNDVSNIKQTVMNVLNKIKLTIQ